MEDALQQKAHVRLLLTVHLLRSTQHVNVISGQTGPDLGAKARWSQQITWTGLCCVSPGY